MILNNLDDIVTFLKVVDNNSFSSVAKVMNQTPSSVSKQIARLEAALKTSLFERNTRKIKITDEGKAIAERARAALAILEDISDIANKGNSHLIGNIKITAPSAFGEKYLTLAIASFIKKHPEVSFNVQFTDHILDLYSNNLDLALRFGQLTDSRLIAKPLATSHRILVASPEYIKSHPILHPQELENHNCLVFSYPGLIQHTWSLHSSGQQANITVSGNLRSDNGQALRAWSVSGLGIALRETWSVIDEIKTGQLVQVLPDWKESATVLNAIRARREPIPRRLRTFIDYLADEWRDADF
ncbi:LysR family transcriptional regulator [Xenorhabdus hominickii]|uniref:LysR family transcriptional regulator n=1 Tax=Xenorhabdus hominickii TaxID=351679 RepID=A0A2G0Q711_XENHO|nr:LysR family transcriptional regulator [Xenorhabdus hominickii]AOM39250.1 LysR family transcriptional regulator [Xenorhabdus hominickii]PHM55009.1 LysR family transcriptional regulator [Xenorhabdus hominickii]